MRSNFTDCNLESLQVEELKLFDVGDLEPLDIELDNNLFEDIELKGFEDIELDNTLFGDIELKGFEDIELTNFENIGGLA